MDDNYSLWERKEAYAEAWLKKRPICCYCGEHIQADFAYYIDGEWYCEDCMDSEFKRAVDDF